MNDQSKLQQYIKDEMSTRRVSLRSFSKITNIDHATLSKIMNGKRQANLNHLQKLSDSLSADLNSLLKLAGYTVSENDELEQTWSAVQKIADEMNDVKETITYEHVQQEISYFEDYSQTAAGKEKIHAEFNAKMEETQGIGKYVNQLKAMYGHFISGHGHLKDQILIGAALLYFIVTTDLIPDYLLPIGLLDDAFIVQAISQRLENKSMMV